jgi:hypothetical protein
MLAAEVVSGGKNMAGIKTYPQPAIVFYLHHNPGQIFEAAADFRAPAGHCLQQNSDLVTRLLSQSFVYPRYGSTQACMYIVAHSATGVKNNTVDTQPAGGQ